MPSILSISHLYMGCSAMKSNAQQQRWLIKINAWPAGGIAGKPTDEAERAVTKVVKAVGGPVQLTRRVSSRVDVINDCEAPFAFDPPRFVAKRQAPGVMSAPNLLES
jgi:fructose-specific phosphotransferase system component IIB